MNPGSLWRMDSSQSLALLSIELVYQLKLGCIHSLHSHIYLQVGSGRLSRL